MNIPKINNLSFQKKLVAKATIGEEENPQKVRIYELDKKGDVSILKNAKLFDKDWENSEYLQGAIDYYGFPGYICYAMLNDEKKLVNFALIDDDCIEDAYTLELLETAPKYSSYRDDEIDKDRKYKYAGETMLAYLAQKSKNNSRDLIVSSIDYSTNAEDFYLDQCGFSEGDHAKSDAVLKGENIDDFLEENKNHLVSSLDFYA